jgi:predicted phosphodiesterase
MALPLLTVGLVADMHYAPRVLYDRYCSDSLGKLQAALRTFAEREVGLVVNLGDSINVAEEPGTEGEYLRAVAEVLAAYPGQCRCVMGNHEVEALTKAEACALLGEMLPAPHYTFEAQGIHCVVLDGNCHEDGSDFACGEFDWAQAWLAEGQLRWLAADLAAHADCPTVIFCHENLDERLWEGNLDPHVLRNEASVREIIAVAGNVRAIIQGHYHVGRWDAIEGIPVFTAAAMVTGPGLENNAFAIVTLNEDGCLEVEGFGRQESGSWKDGQWLRRPS